MFTPPTRGEKLTWTAFYTVIAASGFVVLIMPPKTIEGPLGDWLTLAWGIFLTVALIPAIGSIKGKYKWEYVTLPLVIAGVGIYALMAWHLTWDTPTRAAQALTISALVIGLFNRWLERRQRVKRDKQRSQTRADPNIHAG